MLLNNTLGNIANELKAKVNSVLEKLYIFSKVKDIKSRTNEIVTESVISSQTEMIKRTLEEREKQIAKSQVSGKEIRQVKDQTRQATHTSLAK